MADALQVSIDQLAELLTESHNTGTTRALSADTEVTIPMLLPEVQSKVQPGRIELEDLIPQVAGTVEALRRALRSAGVGPEDRDAMLLAGRSSAVPTTVGTGGFAGSDVSEPARTEIPHRPSLTAVPLDFEPAEVQRRRDRSRRLKRFAAAGVLALILAGGAASAPFITSRNDSSHPATAGTPAPVADIPAPDPGSGNSPRSEDSTGAIHAAPAAPNKPADGPATARAAGVLAPHTTRATSDGRATSRSKPPAARKSLPPPRTAVISAEAHAWSQAAALSASDQPRTRFRPAPPPRP